jgi:glycosidase
VHRQHLWGSCGNKREIAEADFGNFFPHPDDTFHPVEQRVRIATLNRHIDVVIAIWACADDRQAMSGVLCEAHVRLGRPLHRCAGAIAFRQTEIVPHSNLVAVANHGSTGQGHHQTVGKFQPPAISLQHGRETAANWRNPKVQAAMFDVLRFWLRRGVDGFRVDVMWMMIKDEQFRDNPPNPGYQMGQPSNSRLLPVYNTNRPEVHEVVARMRAVVDEFPERVLIGEIYLPLPQLMTYYGADLKGANLPFNFLLLQCAWTAEAVKRVITDYYGALPKGAWPNWVLGNHDNARIASRVGAAQARIAAMLLLTLPGTLTLCYGEEIGMRNVLIAPEAVQDPAEKNEPGVGQGRDPERTPMPWDDSAGGGFTAGRPWLPIGQQESVAKQRSDPTSMLQLYRSLIELRRTHSVLVTERLQNVVADNHVLQYERRSEEQCILVLLNFASNSLTMPVGRGTILVSTVPRTDGRDGQWRAGVEWRGRADY